MIADIYDDRFVVCNSCAWGRGLQCCEGCSSLSFSVCEHLVRVSTLVVGQHAEWYSGRAGAAEFHVAAAVYHGDTYRPGHF